MSSPRRIGLPTTLHMRHDNHFVDQLGRPGGAPVGRFVPIEDIEPNPNQPRHALGELAELTASIREKGVLEPILVRTKGSRFQIIAGERRYRAALEAGLSEIPCIVREAEDSEMMELALIENLQRKDLTAFEEAEGLRSLVESYGYTHEKMAAKLGKSRSSISEALSLATMPEQVRQICRLADIHSKSLLLQIIRHGEPEKMIAFIERLQREGGTRQKAREIVRMGRSKTKGRPRNFVFHYQPKEKSFRLSLQFRQTDVPREEIIHTLEAVLSELRSHPHTR